jgi:hypothetical protein
MIPTLEEAKKIAAKQSHPLMLGCMSKKCSNSFAEKGTYHHE